MPNKDSINKRFAELHKKIKDILEMLAGKSGGANEEDAMFTRKPYGAAACASCEKGLIDIQGRAVDYYAWKKMPRRQGGNDNIARYGQGFSKLLSNLQIVDSTQSPPKTHFSSVDIDYATDVSARLHHNPKTPTHLPPTASV